jgi:proteasome activator subunit 4
VEIYASSSQQPPLDTPLAQMDETRADVFNFFNNPANIEKLITYLSLEEKKGRDKFNSKRYILFKVLLPRKYIHTFF